MMDPHATVPQPGDRVRALRYGYGGANVPQFVDYPDYDGLEASVEGELSTYYVDSLSYTQYLVTADDGEVAVVDPATLVKT